MAGNCETDMNCFKFVDVNLEISEDQDEQINLKFEVRQFTTNCSKYYTTSQLVIIAQFSIIKHNLEYIL